ncbi:uncharacterized protein LOC107227716 [Neodiprion lecontei]|uniref:Uncharacterized protein LOC107227716 n=1 Tax=Neodiprion lecontei TaxID=441921 RepID=A0A6J0CEA0_NEOLC|nr:uncharacterized protein LOC107227716 [Neodiprion lecontei]
MKQYNIDMYSPFSNLKALIKPANVTIINEKQLCERVYKLQQVKCVNRKRNFKVGDLVRISKYKNLFEKGYSLNWATEIFTVNEVKNTKPTTYKHVDYQDKSIEGGLYEEELNKVKYHDGEKSGYVLEKVLRQRGNQPCLKWLGFDSSHNSWIDETNL